MIILLFLLNLHNFQVEVNPGILFNTTQPSSFYFDHIYNISVDGKWKLNNTFIPGVYADFFKKTSRPYQDQYFQDPDLSLKMFTFGLGGSFDYRITDYFLVGAGVGVYNINFRYPYTRDSGEVTYENTSRTNFGFYSSFSLIKPIGKFSVGASLKVYIIGKNEYYYDNLVYPLTYDTRPDFPTPIQGITLTLNLGYSP